MITLTKEDAFTIVDIISKAQEIVHCKDCKYSWTPEHPNKYYCHINYHISKDDPDGYVDNEIEWAADDFCSRGERINGTRKTD